MLMVDNNDICIFRHFVNSLFTLSHPHNLFDCGGQIVNKSGRVITF